MLLPIVHAARDRPHARGAHAGAHPHAHGAAEPASADGVRAEPNAAVAVTSAQSDAASVASALLGDGVAPGGSASSSGHRAADEGGVDGGAALAAEADAAFEAVLYVFGGQWETRGNDPTGGAHDADFRPVEMSDELWRMDLRERRWERILPGPSSSAWPARSADDHAVDAQADAQAEPARGSDTGRESRGSAAGLFEAASPLDDDGDALGAAHTAIESLWPMHMHMQMQRHVHVHVHMQMHVHMHAQVGTLPSSLCGPRRAPATH